MAQLALHQDSRGSPSVHGYEQKQRHRPKESIDHESTHMLPEDAVAAAEVEGLTLVRDVRITHAQGLSLTVTHNGVEVCSRLDSCVL